MKLIYKGKFDGDAASIPHGTHHAGAVRFKEIEDVKQLAMAANAAALLLVVVLFAGLYLRAGTLRVLSPLGCVLSLCTLFPHELLHALCFRHEVYLYTNLRQGMMFVTGPEDMSRTRFVLMSLLPNLVFGVVPYVLFMLFPTQYILGALGALCLSMGTGDYMNVFNACTQMPPHTRTYLYGFHSYWYLPEAAQ